MKPDDVGEVPFPGGCRTPSRGAGRTELPAQHRRPRAKPPTGRRRAGEAGGREEERGDRTQPPPRCAPLPGSTRSAPSAAAAVPRPPPSGPAPFRAALAAPGLTWPGRARRLWRRLRRRLGPAAAREGFCKVGRELPAPEPPPAALTHPAAPSERAGRGEGRGGRGQGRGGRSAPRGAAAPGAALKEPPGAAPRDEAGRCAGLGDPPPPPREVLGFPRSGPAAAGRAGRWGGATPLHTADEPRPRCGTEVRHVSHSGPLPSTALPARRSP